MKKVLLAMIMAAAMYGQSSAQTNTFPTTGNVGVGTTSPAYLLQVGNIWNNLGSNYALAVGGDFVIGNTNTGSQPYLRIYEGTNGGFTQIKKYTGYTAISDQQGVINLDGKVGIGTTNPQTLFHVYGSTPIRMETNSGNILTGFEAASVYYGGVASGLYLYPGGPAIGNNVFGENVNNSLETDLFQAGPGNLKLGVVGTGKTQLYTNGAPVLTAMGNGNIGIGTTSPTSILQVNGETAIRSSTTTDGYLSINPGGASNQGYINWWKPGNTRVGYLGYTDGVGTNNLALTLEASANFIVNGGNVGIATTAPTSLFQVDDGCTKASIGDASGIGLNYGTSYLGFNASRSGTNWLTNGDGGNNGGGVIYSSIFGDMYFSIIPSTGGSGQTLADAVIANNIALKISHTDGAVYAKKIYVQLTGFPDYVFKKDYRLMPLAQVKNYIDQNHHLPEMPTDKEVEAKGLDVGEMNKLLTKKVEELTLYLIELKAEKEKEKKEQNELIKKMEQRLNALEKQ